MKYESPKFEFMELRLFERIAEVCWGTAQVWLDTNGDKTITNADIQISTGGGCQGNWSAGRMNQEIASYNAMVEASGYGQNLDVVASYNAGLAEYIRQNPQTRLEMITAHAQSNWANTKQKSGGGLIIIGS